MKPLDNSLKYILIYNQQYDLRSIRTFVSCYIWQYLRDVSDMRIKEMLWENLKK